MVRFDSRSSRCQSFLESATRNAIHRRVHTSGALRGCWWAESACAATFTTQAGDEVAKVDAHTPETRVRAVWLLLLLALGEESTLDSERLKARFPRLRDPRGVHPA